MANPKSNPKRWYLAMYLCIIVSFWTFIAGPRLGYSEAASYGAAILVGLWAPVLAIFGLRAELLQKTD